MTIEVKVLISVCGFSIDFEFGLAIFQSLYVHVQHWQMLCAFGVRGLKLHGELDAGVDAVEMLGELFYTILVNGFHDIIHISQPNRRLELSRTGR